MRYCCASGGRGGRCPALRRCGWRVMGPWVKPEGDEGGRRLVCLCAGCCAFSHTPSCPDLIRASIRCGGYRMDPRVKPEGEGGDGCLLGAALRSHCERHRRAAIQKRLSPALAALDRHGAARLAMTKGVLKGRGATCPFCCQSGAVARSSHAFTSPVTSRPISLKTRA